MTSSFLLAAVFLFLAGCAPISSQALSLIDRTVSFAELRRDPDRYTGRYFLIGGEIAGVRNTSDWAELEVVQFRTDEEGRIADTVSSGGRFIALVSAFLDPAVYRSGVFMTMVGQVEGQRIIPINATRYVYPVLTVKEMHLWNHAHESPPSALNFEIGSR